VVASPDLSEPLSRLRWCLDLSHHPWTRPAAAATPAAAHDAAGQTISMILAADAAGLDSAWVSEDPDGWDAYAVLAAATMDTRTIRLGPGVTNPYLRHPNLIAMSSATLDRLSGGRSFIGLGRGQPEWYGPDRSAGGSPLQRLESTIRLLRQWQQPPHRAASRREPIVDDWARAIHPIQHRVPIYLAAIGPRALDLAARLADGVLIADFATIPFLERLIPDMRRRVAGYGRDPDAFHFFIRTGISITDDLDAALRYRKSLMAVLSPLPGMSQQIEHPDFDIAGIVERVASAMGTREALARGGNFIDIRSRADFETARAAIPDELIAEISYVGSATSIRAKLNRLAEIGATHVFLSAPDKPEPAAFRAMIEAIAGVGE
jgi:5,10-methylenetetrahydromethanopterin reductase